MNSTKQAFFVVNFQYITDITNNTIQYNHRQERVLQNTSTIN
jgi:hypothetical protein